MGSEPELDAETLLSLIREVAAELPGDGVRRRLVVVGGALLAWHGLRASTRDIDTVARLDVELRRAVSTVAARHGLAHQWINDSATGFLPQGFDPERGSLIWADDRLEVVGASRDDVLLMKILAGRATDTPDIRALWSHAGFATPAAAARAFFKAYPSEPCDDFLADWIEEQIR